MADLYFSQTARGRPPPYSIHSGTVPLPTLQVFQYGYGYSFCFCAISFLVTEATGVASLYLFIKQETYALRSEKERLRHRLTGGSGGSGTSVATGSTQTIPLKANAEVCSSAEV